MKLQLLIALSVMVLGACSSASDASEESSGVPDAGGETEAGDAGLPEGAIGAEAGGDALPDGPVFDSATDASSLLVSREAACISLHGCLGIEGVRKCLMSAHANAEASPDELRFGLALQSIVMQGTAQPDTPATLYLPSVMDCVAAAASCDAVRACVGDGAPCDPEQHEPSCEPGGLRYCLPTAEGGVVVTTDCAEMGLQCMASSTPMGTVAQCAEGACDMGTSPSCEGNTARNCILGGWLNQPCSTMPGTQCAILDEMGMDMAQCRGDGPDCEMSHVPTCEGDDLRICQGYKQYTMACPPGGACAVDPESGAGGCWGSTLFCGPESCEGAVLRYCVDGEPRSVDCGAHGFSACLDGEAGARCAGESPAAL